jgi:hypothetical protein
MLLRFLGRSLPCIMNAYIAHVQRLFDSLGSFRSHCLRFLAWCPTHCGALLRRSVARGSWPCKPEKAGQWVPINDHVLSMPHYLTGSMRDRLVRSLFPLLIWLQRPSCFPAGREFSTVGRWLPKPCGKATAQVYEPGG